MRVLGIETSCDETAVAVVEGPAGSGPVGRILSNTIYSQLTEHRRFGGVVPEIAARAHLERIDGLVAQALDVAGLGLAFFTLHELHLRRTRRVLQQQEEDVQVAAAHARSA